MKRRAWNSTLSAPTKPMKKQRETPRRPRHLECRAFLDWLKTRPCFITGHLTGEWITYQGHRLCVEVDPAHLVKTKGARAGDLGFALPLAHHLHEQQHTMGIRSWRRLHGLTEDGVRDVAELYAAEFLRLHPEACE